MEDKQSFKITSVSFDGGFRQIFAAFVVFFLLFLLPVAIHENNLQTNNRQAGQQSEETYTRKALEDSQGRVGGISTDAGISADRNTANTSANAAATKRYLMIPVLNFRLDKTLSDPASVSFVFGMIFLVIALVLAWILGIDYWRKNKF
ncbi:MAG TPA: hypothetical protein VJC17_04440 [Candidatus Dojkabacteria bacterium]|nr:hypothetical protein [Candidatus Dojkabacteria bacterium]